MIQYELFGVDNPMVSYWGNSGFKCKDCLYCLSKTGCALRGGVHDEDWNSCGRFYRLCTTTIKEGHSLKQRIMTKEELRKEFDELCDPDEQHHKKTGFGYYVYDDYKFDWFWAKLKEKDQEIANHIAVNNLLLDSDIEATLANRIFDLESKLKAADEVVERVESYISDTVYDRDKYDKMTVSLKYYKSLKL